MPAISSNFEKNMHIFWERCKNNEFGPTYNPKYPILDKVSSKT